MRTARSSSCLLGGVSASVHAGIHPQALVWTPPGPGPGHTPWVWAWRPPSQTPEPPTQVWAWTPTPPPMDRQTLVKTQPSQTTFAGGNYVQFVCIMYWSRLHKIEM